MVYARGYEVTQPRATPPPRFTFAMSWEAAQDINSYNLNLPPNAAPWLGIAQCFIGDYLDANGLAGFDQPSLEILCKTDTLEMLSKRPSRSTYDAEQYLAAKARAYWDLLRSREVPVSIADQLRLGIPLGELHSIALVHEGTNWTLGKSGPGNFTLNAGNQFLAQRSQRREDSLPQQHTRSASKALSIGMEARQEAIAQALAPMLPYSAKAYRQVVRDAGDPNRLSYGGATAELREVVGAILRHLAPDGDVKASAGYEQEPGTRGPTMRQRAAYIIKKLHLERGTLMDSVEKFDDPAAALARSVYSRGSGGLHSTTDRAELSNLLGYADAVLAELLNVHGSSSSERGV